MLVFKDYKGFGVFIETTKMSAQFQVYRDTAAKSPFLTQNLDTYFLGGMYDMSLWTTSIWSNVMYILQNGFRLVFLCTHWLKF